MCGDGMSNGHCTINFPEFAHQAAGRHASAQCNINPLLKIGAHRGNIIFKHFEQFFIIQLLSFRFHYLFAKPFDFAQYPRRYCVAVNFFSIINGFS